MNSCVLMAEITKAPELRYTQDGQTTIAEMWVQFPPLRSGDPMETLKAVGWGNLAQQIQEQFQIGDQVIIEGRLGMITIERAEGFKEKQAEITISRIHTADMTMSANPPSTNEAVSSAPAPAATMPSSPPSQPAASPSPEPNYDDIPF